MNELLKLLGLNFPDGLPIALQFSSDARWTKALKHLLANLKWILAHCCT